MKWPVGKLEPSGYMNHFLSDLSQTETKVGSWSLPYHWDIKELTIALDLTQQEILCYFNYLLDSGGIISQMDIATKMGQ